MKLAAGLMALLLAPYVQAAEDSPRPDTEVTVGRSDQFVAGLGFGGPIGAAVSLGLLHGLGADVEEESERVKAVCAAPIPQCLNGFLLQIEAGSGGGKVSLGLGGRARVKTEDWSGNLGASLKASLARTWGSPIGTEPNLTYLGPELDFTVKHVGASVGVLWRVDGQGGANVLFSWGLGLRF